MSLTEPFDPLLRVVEIERLVSKIYFVFRSFSLSGERRRREELIMRALEQAEQDRKEAAKLP